MSEYLFKIKKDSFELELLTSDKQLLSEQLEKWIKEVSAYVRLQKGKECKELVRKQIKAEAEITKKNIQHYTENLQKDVVLSNEEQLITDKNEITSKSNLDLFYEPKKEESISNNDEVSSTKVFDSILEKSLTNPKADLTFKTSPTIKKDNAFLNYITTRKIERKIDYLLLTAYYFAQYEGISRFTLKQLNSKLMQNIAVIIDHSVLQEAINRDYIECLPDLTGLVGASEYRLTAYGEKVLLDE